ncbi:hypothetical protein K402DRAFT_455789 [Aulographum hederae CBS 113979]|uniref:phosphoinositide 5-phosphatase n=1 Tax=Aulographum hederae CBS 113979 TaxID=1176131 RepID=A0A6G1GV23_9PEZI|nr:hypothetical protein K402DRAFT_455789 [Aulographum hederae CBS 113979]
MSIRVLIRESPARAIALATTDHVLIFRHSPSSTVEYSGHSNGLSRHHNLSSTALDVGGNGGGEKGGNGNGSTPRCMVEFARKQEVDLSEYRSVSSQSVYGTLGLMTVEGDVFLCVVGAATKTATVRPGETVQRILSVDFHCLNSSSYDHVLNDEINPYPTDTLGDDGFEYGHGQGRQQSVLEHPCLAIKKLLSSGTFYYSADFDVTRRLQDRLAEDAPTIALDSLESGLLWNSYMIQPLVDFRSRLSSREKSALDASKILTSAIRGFVSTVLVPAAASPARQIQAGPPSTLTLISRLSCRRAGTRFNARGIDDDGNVANFVETETVLFVPPGMCFSYVQIRGSVPLFWEQATGLLPNQQKITITRSPEATQPAFDKHFERLEMTYGAVHVVNLLSNEKSGEIELTKRYHYHISRSSLNSSEKGAGMGEGDLLKETAYDFHAETRGDYDAARGIKLYIQDSADAFAYHLSEEVDEPSHSRSGDRGQMHRKPMAILQQEGVFRTNCLDCLDRTNLVQTIISQMAVQVFLDHRSERGTADFWVRHGSLWADNGDHLSRIYAGTGALKSSFTRHGKMSIAGALADARKSATRMYINNFADKGRQNTIDMLLGRLMGQTPVSLYDPINDYVTNELSRRAKEYSTIEAIHILVGTFNANGKSQGINEDISSWLCPNLGPTQQCPEIVAVGFQEIVELSPQQIMSTDPAPRQAWETAVKNTLNDNAAQHGVEEYVLLRGGQLVGASLSIFARSDVLKFIKNVEGSLKKTGLSGAAGNKGAVAIRMEYANTSLCFVTAHLAAGFANYEERNRDYKTISHGLRFQRNRSIEDHDSVVWLGDFNYRIGLDNEKVKKLIQMGDLETLYANDQLNLQMVAGLTFPFYQEARITFPPTYKYDLGSDTYDTSEKSRIPAWCDRVLRKGNNLRQINYNTAPLRFSDHRPVYATFECTVNMVDEKRRDQLSNNIYQQRRRDVGSGTANANADETEDEDLIGYEAIEPGLPPASSDRRKWWLDNGQPARAQIQPPGKDFMPNPKMPSNPFTPTNEPDWVQVERFSPPSGLSTRNSSQAPPPVNASLKPTPSRTSSGSQRAILPPPLMPRSSSGGLVSGTGSRNDEQQHHQSPQPLPGLARAPSYSSIRSLPLRPPPSSNPDTPPQGILAQQQTASRKPPIPRKPITLTKTGSSSASTPGSPRLAKVRTSDGGVGGQPLPPPPRRSTAPLSQSQAANGSKRILAPPPGRYSDRMSEQHGDGEEEEEAPGLPPRRGTGLQEKGMGKNRGLMDMEDEEGMDSLRGWTVLRPG